MTDNPTGRGYCKFYPLALVLAHTDLYSASPDQNVHDLFRVYCELERILRTREKLTCLNPECHWSGDVTYESSTGWKFVIFDDCGGWVYIENVITLEGEDPCKQFGWEYFEQPAELYHPTDDDLVCVWSWPNYEWAGNIDELLS